MLKPGAEKFNTKEIISSIFVDYPKQEWVGGGYSCPGVGEVTKVGEFLHSSKTQLYQFATSDVQLSKKCIICRYFAGEFACRYKWCGFMEGALVSLIIKKREREPIITISLTRLHMSGAGVANEILNSLSKKREKKQYDKNEKKTKPKENMVYKLYFKFNPTELKELERVFKGADTNKSGELDLVPKRIYPYPY